MQHAIMLHGQATPKRHRHALGMPSLDCPKGPFPHTQTWMCRHPLAQLLSVEVAHGWLVREYANLGVPHVRGMINTEDIVVIVEVLLTLHHSHFLSENAVNLP